MSDVCKDTGLYHKSDLEEIIEVGDVIMIDPDTETVTRAVANNLGEMCINSRFIVGVVIQSDNISNVDIDIDGGIAKDTTKEPVDGGGATSKPEYIVLEGGIGQQNMREYVRLAYAGEVVVNVCGFVQLGDRLTISEHAGKAKAIDYIDNDYFRLRSIGKVIKYINPKQVKVLLDIE